MGGGIHWVCPTALPAHLTGLAGTMTRPWNSPHPLVEGVAPAGAGLAVGLKLILHSTFVKGETESRIVTRFHNIGLTFVLRSNFALIRKRMPAPPAN